LTFTQKSTMIRIAQPGSARTDPGHLPSTAIAGRPMTDSTNTKKPSGTPLGCGSINRSRHMKSKRKAKQQRRPIPRPLLNKMLVDLEQRAERQTKLVESIQALVEPNGETKSGEQMIRIAIGAALTTLASGMYDLSGFASIIAEDRAVRL
jgi:hypothetical protein